MFPIVLVRDRIHLSDLQAVLDPQEGQGRLLRIDFCWEDRPITVVGVYAPSVAGSSQFCFLTSLSPLLAFRQAGDCRRPRDWWQGTWTSPGMPRAAAGLGMQGGCRPWRTPLD